jgi:hypothetical protein
MTGNDYICIIQMLGGYLNSEKKSLSVDKNVDKLSPNYFLMAPHVLMHITLQYPWTT